MEKTVNIRPHLIPFLYEENGGKIASYMDIKAKSIKISTYSPLGMFLMEKITKQKKIKTNKFILYLTIEQKRTLNFTGVIYYENKGFFEELKLSEKYIDQLNDLLENIFRVSFFFYMKGCETTKNFKVIPAIQNFINQYGLEEAGIDVETLRTNYYREPKEPLNRLNRFSNRRSINCATF